MPVVLLLWVAFGIAALGIVLGIVNRVYRNFDGFLIFACNAFVVFMLAYAALGWTHR